VVVMFLENLIYLLLSFAGELKYNERRRETERGEGEG